MWNASAITCAMSSPSRTRKLCLVIGMVMPEMSASWKASVPISARPTWPGDRHHRDRIHLRVGQRGDQVRRARTRGRHAHADLAGGVGVSAGGVSGALLVAHQDVAQLLRVEQRVVHRQHRAAGDAEDDLDVEFLQRPDHRLRAGELMWRNAFRSWTEPDLSAHAGSRRWRGAAGSGGRVVGALTLSSSPSVVSFGLGRDRSRATKNPRQRLLHEGCASMLVACSGLGYAPTRYQLLRAIPWLHNGRR